MTVVNQSRMVQGLRKQDTNVLELRSRLESWKSGDGWENPFTGYGTGRDKTTFTTYAGFTPLSDANLSNLFHGDDTAQRMVSIVPDEMYREGFDVATGDPGLDLAIDEQFESLGVCDKFAEAERWGRCFGGCVLLLGADDGKRASQPLELEKAKALSFLYVLDRRYLWPLTWYTAPGHPKLGEPETYFVTSPSSMAQETSAIVHESRMIKFGGAPTGQREREILASWDYSVLQVAYDTLAMFNSAWKSLEHLLADGYPAVFKMQGLAEALGADDSTSIIEKRMRALDMNRSNGRMMVLDAGGVAGPEDKGEEFERQSITLTGVPESIDKVMLRLASTVMVPVTIFMGQSPAGMNATGVSDFRWFYDRLRSAQKRKTTPKVRRTVKVMLGAKEFKMPTGHSRTPRKIDVSFPPLWNETPLERAQRIQALTTSDKLAIDAGQWLPEEVASIRGMPGGYDRDIVLSKESMDARTNALESELSRLEEMAGEPTQGDPDFEDPNKPPPPVVVAGKGGAGAPPAFGKGGGGKAPAGKAPAKAET